MLNNLRIDLRAAAQDLARLRWVHGAAGARSRAPYGDDPEAFDPGHGPAELTRATRGMLGVRPRDWLELRWRLARAGGRLLAVSRRTSPDRSRAARVDRA